MISLPYATRMRLKAVLSRLQRYRPAEQGHVALFASRRGGSTWIMEVIAANSEFRYIAQPFVAYDGATGYEPAGQHYNYANFVCPADAELASIASFIDSILSGRISPRSAWRLWQPRFWSPKSRTVMKILQAKPLMPWFEERFGLTVIYLLRHPMAQAASVIGAKWTPLHGDYLGNAEFVETQLSPSQRAFCFDVVSRGSALETHVLDWCLENLIPIRTMRERSSWCVLSYEDCITRPEFVLERLAEALGLDGTEAMNRQIGRPSATTRITNKSTGSVLGAGQLRKWEAAFPAAEIARAFKVLETLEIGVYVPGSPMPVL